MGKIQKLLKESDINQAVALLRASREVWPEGEVFGHVEIRPDEELLFLRELFFADLPSKSTKLYCIFIIFFFSNSVFYKYLFSYVLVIFISNLRLPCVIKYRSKYEERVG